MSNHRDDSTWRRFRSFWRLSVRRDVDDEIAFHFAMRVDEFMASGMTRDDAEREARSRFGDDITVRAALTTLGNAHRRRRDWRDRWDGVRQDATVVIRSLRRAPLFAFGVIVTLAIGIGANATMFGVVDRLLLSGPDGVRDARHLQRIYFATNASSVHATNPLISFAAYAALRDHAHSIEHIGVYSDGPRARFGNRPDAPRVPVGSASWDFFTTLGLRAALGRFFTADEDRPPRGASVAVISYAFWQNMLAGDSSIVGKVLSFDGKAYSVIGVAPAEFTGIDEDSPAVWFPVTARSAGEWSTTFDTSWLRAVVRLNSRVTVAQAMSEANAVFRASYQGVVAQSQIPSLVMHPLWFNDDGSPSPASSMSLWLGGIALLMLLIVCANVANLLIARTLRRRHEIAVRSALGIGRARLVRLLGMEVGVLALSGTGWGLIIAMFGARLMHVTLLAESPTTIPSINFRLLAFAAAAAVLVCATLTAMSVTYASRATAASTLKAGARDGGGRRDHVRATLFVVQAALCAVLLIVAGLFVESVSRLRAIDFGFAARQTMTVYANFTYPGVEEYSPAARMRDRQNFNLLRRRLSNVPTIEDAAVVIGGPYSADYTVPVFVPNRDSTPHGPGLGPYIAEVDDHFFSTMRIRATRGRLFDVGDREGSALVAVVNETMARLLWPSANPIGQCIRIQRTDAPCTTVVGVVGDIHRHHLRESIGMQYYVPLSQGSYANGGVIVVRPRGTLAELNASARAVGKSMADSVAISALSMEESIDQELRPWRQSAMLLGAFASVAFLVAMAGLYSLVAYLVADRTHELGVRMALGAAAPDILKQIVGGGVKLVALGATAGVGIIIVTGRMLEPLLYGATPRAPALLIAVSLAMVVVAAIAAYFPARRATRIDPMSVLRAD